MEIFLIFGLVIAVFGLCFYYIYKHFKNDYLEHERIAAQKLIEAEAKSQKAEKAFEEARVTLAEAKKLKVQHEEYQKDIDNQILALTDKKLKLLTEIESEKARVRQTYLEEKAKIDVELEKYKQNYSNSCEQYGYVLEQSYKEAERKYHENIAKIEQEKNEAAAALQKLKDSLAAGMKAQLREKKKEENLEFYKLHISDNDLKDVYLLENIKPQLTKPVVLAKVIWSTYFQKQTTDLCNRIVGSNPVCGIYKITNLKTKQVYIGQTTDISTRFKNHIKCGLGIDAPATNKLYNSMQQDGVWNFTFEVIEKCNRNELDEKEKFWIETYQSNVFGLNVQRGVTK